MDNKKHVVLTEYQRITWHEKLGSGYVTVTKAQFEALENFVLSNELDNASTYLKLGQSGSIKFLQARNYIGVIQLTNGLTIEILPKIAHKSDNDNHEEIRDIVVSMLRTLRDSPFKKAGSATLKSQRMSLLDAFISMYMDELEELIRRGIKSDYIGCEENFPFLKGKLLFSEQIKRNLVRKERFFVGFDNYQADRIENRIVKTTLIYLYKITRSVRNQQRIREALFVFDEIQPVHDIIVAFSRVNFNRQLKDYEQILVWSRLFLLGDSFTPHKGSVVAFALLFDMNLLFESYVGARLKRIYGERISLQSSGCFLAVKNNRGVFALKPDIVIEGGVIIADTKWKLLDETDRSKAGISQADMYQMFAYANKYTECQKVILIYPKTEAADYIKVGYCFEDPTGCKQVSVEILFFDLTNSYESQSFRL